MDFSPAKVCFKTIPNSICRLVVQKMDGLICSNKCSFYISGVLNPFELAIVNNGLKKSEGHLLPVIEDEVWRSMESNSTLDSEGSSLTRLEMDLFEDIRATDSITCSSLFKP